MYQRVNFTTEDGVIIVGDYYSAENAKGHVLFLHMMPALKESWQECAKVFVKAGFSCLAIDQRGHGESVKTVDGRTLNFKDFDDAKQQSKILDVRAAANWLQQQGAEITRVALVGASIGANLSLRFLVETPGLPTAVLLSPGLDYRGIKVDELARKLPEGKTFMCVAAGDDDYSYQTCRALFGITGEVKVVQLPQGGHGTNIFNDHPELIGQMVEWISAKLKV